MASSKQRGQACIAGDLDPRVIVAPFGGKILLGGLHAGPGKLACGGARKSDEVAFTACGTPLGRVSMIKHLG